MAEDKTAASRRVRISGSVAIERNGSAVRIEIACDDPASAARIHEAAVAGARRGRVALDLKTGAPVHEH